MATAVMVAVEMVVDAAEAMAAVDTAVAMAAAAMAMAERVLARRAAKAEGLAAEMATAC